MERVKPERLSDYIKRMGLSMADFASQLGVTREAVRCWCRGDYLPSLANVSEIERVTGGAITARSFYNDEVLSELEQARGAAHG